MNVRTKLTILSVLLAPLAFFAVAQPVDDPILNDPPPDLAPAVAPLPNLRDWPVTDRDQSSTTREYIEPVTNSVTGETTLKHHRVIEICSGISYLDETGVYRDSIPLIEPFSDGGAAAIHGPHKLFVSPNLNSFGAVTLVSTGKRAFRSHILGLYYRDPQTQRSARLSSPRDTIGELHPPNQVVWRSAFDTINADVRVTYDKSGIELDLILLELPPPPGVFGLGPHSRIELWHEFVIDGPAPASKSKVVRRGEDPSLDLVDEILDFGDLWLPTGRGFFAADTAPRAEGTPARIQLTPPAEDGSDLRVAKTWKVIQDRSVLIESLVWADVAALGARLPQSEWTAAQVETAVASASELSAPPARSDFSADRIQPATAPYAPTGFVWDYIAVASSGTSKEFKSEGAAPGTYLVSGSTYFSGTLTFQPGCIIKFEPGAYLLTYGGITCNGTANLRSILTAKTDPRFGENVSSPCPEGYSASVALWDYYICQSLNMKGMRICYATKAIQLDCNGPPYCGTLSHIISDCLIESCQYAVAGTCGGVSIQNSTAVDVSYGTSGFTPKQFLGTHILAGVTAHMAGHNENTDRTLWLNDYYLTEYDPDCYIYGVYGYTSLSPECTGTVGPRVGAGTLISPCHAINAYHNCATPLNQRFRFIGVNNDIHDVYCKASEVIAGTDIQVLLFSNCLPSTVHPVKILGSEALRKLGFPTGMSQDCLLRRIPLIGSTQGSMGGPPDGPFSKVMPIKEWWDQVNGYYLYVRTPRWANWNTAYGGGDGGHPLYAIINNQLVAVGTPYGGASTPPPGNFYGHFWGNRLTEITNAMHNLSSAHGMPDYHHLPVIDLSAFPDYLPPP